MGMTADGASHSLPRVTGTACFLITERALSFADRNGSSCPQSGPYAQALPPRSMAYAAAPTRSLISRGVIYRDKRGRLSMELTAFFFRAFNSRSPSRFTSCFHRSRSAWRPWLTVLEALGLATGRPLYRV